MLISSCTSGCADQKEESLINFQILALMCLIALSFATSLAGVPPRRTPQRHPCGNRAESFTCVFLASLLLDAQYLLQLGPVGRQRLQGRCREFAGCSFVFFYTSWDMQDSEGKRGAGWDDLPSRYGWLVVSLNVAVLESLGDLGDAEFHQRGPEGKHADQNGVGSNHWKMFWKCSDWLPVIVPLIFPPSF